MKSKSANIWQRSHYCGELRLNHAGQEVYLLGWVNRQRDMGNLVFIDLRDREGLVQVMIPAGQEALLKLAKGIKMEYAVGIRGRVKERDPKLRNPDLVTGEIEVEASELKVFSAAEVPPFVIADPPQATEELRFKYRYLDLRRPAMQRNIRLRHEAVLKVRNFMHENGFFEIETPFLTKSTPEGARDYLVPSRIYKGRFFALPQSPQIFKQLLMISGFDRYFQIVRCFRDEDLRADRQPEFTQIDVEMSFMTQERLFSVMEALMAETFSVIGVKVEYPFPCLTYAESMEKYGTDKPDLRFELEIRDLTEIGSQVDSELISSILDSGGELRGLVVPGGGPDYSRSRLDKLNQKARDLGGKGLIWIKKEGEAFKSSLKLTDKDFSWIWEETGSGEQDLVLLSADKKDMILRVLGGIRGEFLPEEVQKQNIFKFAWVTEFPLFEWSEEEDRPVSMHHPFTSPVEEDVPLLEKDPLAVKARAYDLVLNGVEIGGGSVRIHDLDLQQRIFQVLGLSPDEAQEKFGFFLEALRFGAPPHGGIALGLDRIIMILAGEESIRDVIPFPKTTSSLCLLTNSPSEVDDRQLRELGIKRIDSKD